MQLWFKNVYPGIAFRPLGIADPPATTPVDDGVQLYSGKPSFGRHEPDKYYMPGLTQTTMAMTPTDHELEIASERNLTPVMGTIRTVLSPKQQSTFRATNLLQACDCTPQEIHTVADLASAQIGWVQAVFVDPSTAATGEWLYYPAAVTVGIDGYVTLTLPDVEEPPSSPLGRQLTQIAGIGGEARLVMSNLDASDEQAGVAVRVQCCTSGQRVPPFSRDGMIVRVFRHGFVPDPLYRENPTCYTTWEIGVLGRYVRQYFNLCCMHKKAGHVLEYDGAEHGIYRMNGATSAGRIIGDLYANQLTKRR
jgi:hypothetical protein